MSLATRCSSCGTAFRVVQDQLKVSEGWVRCGHCGEVFDALEGLFDLERGDASGWDTGGADLAEAPRADGAFERERPRTHESNPAARPLSAADPATGSNPVRPASPGEGSTGDDALVAGLSAPAGPLFIDPGRPAPEPVAERTDAAPAPASAADPRRDDDPLDAHWFGARRGDRRRGVAPQAWDRDQPDFSDARYDSDLAADPEADAPTVADDPVAADAAALERAVEAPDFVRRAEHQARWTRPAARWALSGVAALAVLALALQVLHHFRDDVAARWPATQPALVAWCGLAGCTLDAPRHIDQVSVESTALARAPGSHAFRLAVALRNRAATPLAAPSLDLTLTDAGGRLVARRALAPQDLAPVTRLMPGAEIVLQAVLETGDPRVSGYTVEIFYP